MNRRCCSVVGVACLSLLANVMVDGREDSVMAATITLSSDKVAVQLSDRTGQVLCVSDPGNGNKVYVRSNHDIYRVNGVDYSENDDVASIVKRAGSEVVLECTNPKLPGWTARKTYQLNGESLTKRVRYSSDDTAVRLFQFNSYVTISNEARNGGSYCQPNKDGYNLNVPVFRPASETNSDYVIQRMDAGAMAFYQPAADKTIAQYRVRQDGKLFGNHWTTSDGKWTKDGWQTSFGAGFLGRGKPAVEVETRLALFDGDPRAIYRSIIREPEFLAWAAKSVPPEWFGEVQLDGMESRYGRYAQPDDWWIYQMLPRELPYIQEGQYTIMFLSIWSKWGFWPYEGPIRFMHTGYAFDGATTPEEVRKTIQRLHAISPKIKVALYTNPACISSDYAGQWEGNIKDVHPDWILYKEDGTPATGEPGSYLLNIANKEYRAVALDQFAHMVDYYGADLFYLDYGGFDGVTHGQSLKDDEKRAVTQADCVEFLHELGELARKKNVPIWTNGVLTPSIQSDLGIFELSAPGWLAYERDWRPFAAAACLAKLWKETRPLARVEVMYPGHVASYNMVGGYGLLGMGVNQTRGFSQVTARLLYGKLGNALRSSRAAEVRIHPDWWKLETTELEAAVLKQGDAYVLPVVWHGGEKANKTIAVTAADMELEEGKTLFAWSSHPTLPIYRNVYEIPGWAEECISIDGFQAIADIPAELKFGMRPEPDELRHIVLTQVPGFVYSINGEREYLLLPDNGHVRISGSAAKAASNYAVKVNSKVERAQVLLYVPPSCANPVVKVDGKETVCQALRFDRHDFALAEVGRGAHEVALADGGGRRSGEGTDLTNPTMNAWKIITDFFPTTSGSAEHRAYQKDGHNCLEILGNAGSFMLTTSDLKAVKGSPVLNPDGIAFWLYGRGKSDSIKVTVGSNQWHYSIDASFKGWRQFHLTREDFTPPGTWGDVGYVTFGYTNAGPSTGEPDGLIFADIRFLPPKGGDAQPVGKPRTDKEYQFRTWNYMPE